MTPQDLLRVVDLTVSYAHPGGRPAVAGVSLSVQTGETLAIVGASGSGKSSLCKAVMSLLPPNTFVGGSFHLFGKRMDQADERSRLEVRRKLLAYVPQNSPGTLNPTRSIGAHLFEAAALRGIGPGPSRIDEARSTLARFEFLDPDAIMSSYAHQLSGGMQQRAALAIALMGRPRLLICDEPTASLDVLNQALLMRHLAEMKSSSGLGQILVTHDLRIAARHADRVLVMNGGQVVESGRAAQILQHPSSPHTQVLVAAAEALSGLA